MSLDLAHSKLGWPAREEIFKPSGEGTQVYLRLARTKLGSALNRHPDASGAKVGVLSQNSASQASESPLAIVCEFTRQVSDQTLRDMQKLAWNFSRCPLLVTIEPHLLRAWTSCEPPGDRLLADYIIREVPTTTLASIGKPSASAAAALALHWINLVSGQFFKENETRFRRDQRADQMLLENLRFVRGRLRETGLSNDDVCHDLLARIIFIQFLFDRKDSSGNPALNPAKLESLHDQNILKSKHDGFADVLGDYEESYRLFRWLNEKFNGDLFPGKGATEAERERAWELEQRHVKERHLEVLQRFVCGKLDMPKGQLCLWKEYAFDAIPLEFISSIYEAFVTERAREGGIYYTPAHMVDMMLDRVLPWGGVTWDLKVLDPACGSGIFLVKAFQRLIHRWKQANPGHDLRAETLRRMLERNLFGVDKDPHAVRVASFSLYLAMCDEIDPRHYWTQVKFPPMRGERLIKADFFEETKKGFRTREDAGSYDLVIGNAPWGEELLTKEAKDWADDENHTWPVANKGIGTLFLPKAAALTKSGGKVAMVQSASSLLFNRSGPAQKFRQKFFATFHIEEVVNLSALRFQVFNKKKGTAQKAVAPACIVYFDPQAASDDRISYVSPKQADDNLDEFQIIIEPHDVKQIHPQDAASDVEVWTALLWGNKRDWAFVRQLRRLQNLETLEAEKTADIREGLIPSKKGKLQRGTVGRRFWIGEEFPDDTTLYLDDKLVPECDGIRTHRKTSLAAFDIPQLVIKQGWQESVRRFQSAITQSQRGKGVLFSQSYLSAHVEAANQHVLEAACLSYNSILAVYFLLLTSSRFASYRPEPLVEELLRVPIPEAKPDFLKGISGRGPALDRRVREAFGFKEAEWVLVEDLFNFTLADRNGDADSPGRRPTQRVVASKEEHHLKQYCEFFIRVLKANFGQDKEVAATIFQEKATPLLPFRLVAFQLDQVNSSPIQIEALNSLALIAELEQLNKTWLRARKLPSGTVYQQRIARIYESRAKSPTIYILKPDACRHWTRSMGLHDADEVVGDFIKWGTVTGNKEAMKGGGLG